MSKQKKYLTTKRKPNYREPRRIQLYAWPHLIHEHSAIIIGAAQTGKTIAYVPAVCSNVKQLITDGDIEEGKGPIALIIAQTANEVQSIAKVCSKCLDHFDRQQQRKVKLVCQAYACFKHEDVEGSLLNGVGILVVTPPCLKRLVKNRVNLFNKNRLRIVVCDNFDIGLKRHGDLIHEMIEHFYCRRLPDGNPTQIVITSNQWENDLIKYTNYGKNTELLIGHYAETALYGQAKLRILMISREEKMEFIFKEYLKDKSYVSRRTIIVCSNEDDAESLSAFLATRLVNVTTYLEDSVEGTKTNAFSWHKQTKDDYTVLLTTDALLGNLVDCKNAQVLINFSLPDTWGRLSFRFSTFFDYYHNFVVQSKPDNYTPPIAVVLIDETENLECFPRFINFMKRTNAQILPEHLKAAERIIAEREENRKSIALCQYFLQFGECNRPMCRDRHTLQPFDKPTNRMPRAGLVLKIHLTHVHNPTLYSGHILAIRRENEQKWYAFGDHEKNTDLVFQMALYYANLDNLRDHGPPKKGDICAYSGGNDQFRRCQILDLPRSKVGRSDLNLLNVKVNIRLIDTGAIRYNVKVNDLYYLPEHLSITHYPPQAVDFHMTGLLPYDGDTDWDQNTLTSVNKILTKYFDMNRKASAFEYIKCKADFVLEGHIWTKTIITVERQVGNQVADMHIISRHLLHEKVAEYDHDQKGIKRIRELAEVMGKFNFIVSSIF